MPYRNDDFQCTSCSHTFTDLWSKPLGDDEASYNAWKGEVTCPECGSADVEKLLAAPGLAEFSMLDKQGRTASLKQRSLNHSKKMMKRDMDKHRATIQRKINAIKG